MDMASSASVTSGYFERVILKSMLHGNFFSPFTCSGQKVYIGGRAHNCESIEQGK